MGVTTGIRVLGQLADNRPFCGTFKLVGVLADGGYGDSLAGFDQYCNTVLDIVGTDYVCTCRHAEVYAEVEAVAGGEILMGVFLNGISTGKVGSSNAADELDLSCNRFTVHEHESVGLDIGNGGLAVLQGTILGHCVGHVAHGKTAGYPSLGSGQEAEAVTLDHIDTFTHVGYVDSCTGFDNNHCAVLHIIGADYV